MAYDHLITKLGSLISSYSKTNAYAPVIRIVGFIVVSCMVGLYYLGSDPVIKYIFIGLIIVSVIFALVMYVILLFKDPKLLQSEHYRIEDKKLDMMALKGSEIQFNPVDLVTPTKEIGETKNG